MEVLFAVSAFVSLLGTLLLVLHRHAVYALLGLLVAFGASAGIFLALDAPFIAVAQILIYAGALAVMFLFVLMFTDTRTDEDVGMPKAITARPDLDKALIRTERRKKSRKKNENALADKLAFLNAVAVPKPMAIVVALSFLVCSTFAIAALPNSFNDFGALPETNGGQSNYDTGLTYKNEAGEVVERHVGFGDTEAVSFTIFEGFPLAFEVVSLLIFAAVLGAVLLARRHLVGIPGTQDVTPEAAE